MIPNLLPSGLWWATAVLAVAYALFFARARGTAAVRPRRLGLLAVAVLALRLLLLAAGYRLEAGPDLALTAATAASAAGLLAAGRWWLVRDGLPEFAERVQAGARGLFLQWAEPAAGCFQLSTKGGTRQLRATRLVPGVLLVALPPHRGRDKVALLVRWLAKQYASPLPKFRIVLNRP